jgi:hypothetical protein
MGSGSQPGGGHPFGVSSPLRTENSARFIRVVTASGPRYLRADSQRQTSDNSVQALQLCQSVAERAEVGGLLEMPTNGAVLGDCTWPECRTIRGCSLRGLDQ